MTHKQKKKFKILLFKFHAHVQLNDKILELAHSYLFHDGPIPFFTDKDLFETTVMYLKDLVVSNNIKDLDELIHYYEHKKQC